MLYYVVMEEEILKTIGLRIAEKRQGLKLSQESLANIAMLHRNYIGCVERAEKHVTVYTLYKITKALGITLEELFKDIK